MNNIVREDIELMAPAGSYEALRAAIAAGANSVYFGAGRLNMRSNSSANFTTEDLINISEICATSGVKSYLTLNTIIYDEDIDLMTEMLEAAKKSGISAVIASDFAVIDYANKINLPVHCSTQLNISNSRAVEHYATFSEVLVLARELNLTQVKKIHEYILEKNIINPITNKQIQIEMFIHGALCMAVSGKCYLSLHEHNKSANRGSCLQPCRRGYTVIEKELGYELDIDNEYIMSPKDLCTIGFLDKILDAGARVLKIEGRGRSPEYVKRTVECYNEALLSIFAGTYSEEKISEWKLKLGEVFNRGFWDGYYLGQKLGEWSSKHGSSASRRKMLLGVVTNYFGKLEAAEILLQSGDLNKGDDILIIGPTTGVLELNVTTLHGDNGETNIVKKGNLCSVAVSQKVRRNDKVYKLIDVAD